MADRGRPPELPRIVRALYDSADAAERFEEFHGVVILKALDGTPALREVRMASRKTVDFLREALAWFEELEKAEAEWSGRLDGSGR